MHTAIIFLTVLLTAPSAMAQKMPADSLPVPIVRQSASHTCGTAALLAVLYYWQAYHGNEADLVHITSTTLDGTMPFGIVSAALEYGLDAYYKENVSLDELRLALRQKKTVILNIQAWPDEEKPVKWEDRREDGHYLVLVGMDKEYAYFMDPSVGTSYTYISLTELPERWHDYEVLESGVWNNSRLAIFISGKNALKKYPGELIQTK